MFNTEDTRRKITYIDALIHTHTFILFYHQMLSLAHFHYHLCPPNVCLCHHHRVSSLTVDLVLELDGPLVAGTRLVVGHDIATMQRHTKEGNGERNLAEDGVVDENLDEDRDAMGLQTVGL